MKLEELCYVLLPEEKIDENNGCFINNQSHRFIPISFMSHNNNQMDNNKQQNQIKVTIRPYNDQFLQLYHKIYNEQNFKLNQFNFVKPKDIDFYSFQNSQIYLDQTRSQNNDNKQQQQNVSPNIIGLDQYSQIMWKCIFYLVISSIAIINVKYLAGCVKNKITVLKTKIQSNHSIDVPIGY
ncbi:hypothetical protein PPERSA_09374 [Pseudocohnilembus persalinus]|uniref:Uncharacterized protein n=1 Tax=Pseudocohnilembus persalinus TaxID=266149 RepID=A0A0V0QLF9_PSEPJ|nr:hypothetical protein PPERSA_09374 [Pseudocohnilembus persalinus]|eukprot:KRX02956.1 hypothetical protein PPERSA_09374 [Pseudocohnilembus persalinus]